MSNYQRWVDRHYPGSGLLTTGEVVERVGRNPRTIRRWVAAGLVGGATYQVHMGNHPVWLWTESDVEELLAFSRTRRAGPRTGDRQPK